MAGHDDEALETLVSDPLTVALMRADRVDPAVLRADLRRAAEKLHGGALQQSFQRRTSPASAVRPTFLAHLDTCGGPRLGATAPSERA
jgi:hypothetical protein